MILLKSNLIIFKTLLFFLFDSLALWNVSPKQKNKFELVLFVRQDAIGDYILWLDTAKEYRKLFPPGKYKIMLVGFYKFSKTMENNIFCTSKKSKNIFWA